MSQIALVAVGSLDPTLRSEIGGRIAAALGLPVVDRGDKLDPEFAFDSVRGQFHSTPLLDALAGARSGRDGETLLGIADQDLFVPILTFVFGEARLDGSAAVFSLARLRPSFYGLPEDRTLLLERSVKEALHELGHTFGLLHCRRPDCVMRASTSADGVDLKPATFCRRCSRSLPRVR